MKRILSTLLVVGTCIAATVSAGAQSIDLAAGGADPIWRGTQAGAKAGASLDQGAVNFGDTRRDLIVGAPGGAGIAGAVYIVNGGPIRTGSLSLASADTVIRGAAAGDLFGAATASGNVISLENTSPRALVVGAPGALGGRGIVYVFAGGFRNGDSLTTANAVVQILGAPGEQLGTALATGDLNNDGYREVIIGAPGSHRVYAIAGGAGLSGTLDLSQSPPPVAMIFDAPGLGGAIASGDVNGDGIYDLIIGQPTNNAAYVIKGRTGMPQQPAVDCVFSGIDAGDGAGTAIRLADVNGDNLTDLIVSAPNGDGPANARTDAGEAYVIWGGSGIATRSLASADVTFYGKDPGGHFSGILASGDINRDLPNDLVSGSPSARSGAGAVDIYYGRSKSSFGVARGDGTRVVDFANEAASRTILGDSGGGTITAIQVFEVTGEGARDVIVGMSGNNGGVGAVYFTISPRLTLGSSSVSLTGEQGILSSLPVPVRNISTIPITWRTASDRPWLSATPSGSTSASAFGDVVVSANGTGLSPGTYTGTISVISTSPHLTMTQSIDVTFVVREPGFPYPATPPVAGTATGAVYNILLRHSTDGYLAMWQMRGTTLTGVQVLSVNQMTYPGWRIAGYGDLNGDGERDIVWQEETEGWLAVWFMQGAQVVNTVWLSINKVDPNWKIAAVGDANGDGKADLIFRHTDGWLGVWYMNGAQVSATNLLSVNRLADPNWKIAGAGDTNADGRADILWQNKATGGLAVWMLNGFQVVSTQMLSISTMTDPQWTMMGVGDVNGDQRADILWQHDDGTLATWRLNGAQVTATFLLNPSRLGNPAWKIAGPK
jgi:hypothetical protein